MELRSHPRYDVQCAISFKGDQVTGEGTLVNISLGGYKIVVSDQTVPNGTYLSLLVHIPGEGSHVEVELAVVRWSKGQEFGLEFLRMGAKEQERLRRYIRSLQANSSS